jgi:hypothetical protein
MRLPIQKAPDGSKTILIQLQPGDGALLQLDSKETAVKADR